MEEQDARQPTRGFGGIGGIGARQGEVVADAMKYEEGRTGGFDPHARIPDMDLDGIDAAFLYPSLGLFAGAVNDPDLAAAMCRAYNRWLADYCKPYPDRLFGVAMLPMQSIDAGDRGDALRAQGARLPRRLPAAQPVQRPKMITTRTTSRSGPRPRSSTSAIGFHEGGNSGMPTVGVDRFEGRGAQAHHLAHDGDDAGLPGVIWGGVCERHPKIRIGFLESGGGWIAPWLDRMDRHFDDKGFNDSGLRTRPSRAVPAQLLDLVRAGREPACKSLADYIGPNKILWATDYPHPRRLLPRRARHGARTAEGHLARDAARRPRRRRDGVLRAELTIGRPPRPAWFAGRGGSQRRVVLAFRKTC